jgi:hypothetical protein
MILRFMIRLNHGSIIEDPQAGREPADRQQDHPAGSRIRSYVHAGIRNQQVLVYPFALSQPALDKPAMPIAPLAQVETISAETKQDHEENQHASKTARSSTTCILRRRARPDEHGGEPHACRTERSRHGSGTARR